MDQEQPLLLVSLNRILLLLQHLDRLVDLVRQVILLEVPSEPVEGQEVVSSVRNLRQQDLEVGHLDLEQVGLPILPDLEILQTLLLKADLELVNLSLRNLTNECS